MAANVADRVRPTVADIPLSAIKEMAVRSAKLADAASLTWGLPSFETPAHIRAAVADAFAHDPDMGKYTLPNGLPELRSLAAQEYLAATGIAVDPDSNVQISAGNMQGMSSLFRTLLEPGDEVIVTDPGFASHYQQIRIAGGTPVPWALDATRDWALDTAGLGALLNDRTKALVLVNPNNPTGVIFPEADLRALAAILLEHGVLLLIDDPYSRITYPDGTEYFHLASDARLREQLVYLFTFSKIHAMSGWRLGYIISPAWLQQNLVKVHDATMICAPRVSQLAGIAALAGNRAHMQTFCEELAQRRTLMCERLERLPHVFRYTRPDGAYYVFPEIVAPHTDSREFALRLLDQAHVAVTPGRAFGPSGEHHVRLAFCVDDDTINVAFDRMETLFGTGG